MSDTTIITDISGASEIELLQEVMDRFDNVVIVLEAPCKKDDGFYNRTLFSGSITNAIGLLDYAKRYLSNELNKHVRSEH